MIRSLFDLIFHVRNAIADRLENFALQTERAYEPSLDPSPVLLRAGAHDA